MSTTETLSGNPEPFTLAILQKFVENQGDLWTLICQHLTRMMAQPRAGAVAATTAEAVATEFHLNRMALLGRRIAELHRALAKPTGDPAFDPEPVTQAEFDQWKSRVEHELRRRHAEHVLELAEPAP